MHDPHVERPSAGLGPLHLQREQSKKFDPCWRTIFPGSFAGRRYTARALYTVPSQLGTRDQPLVGLVDGVQTPVAVISLR
jgi:hypothetical protein